MRNGSFPLVRAVAARLSATLSVAIAVLAGATSTDLAAASWDKVDPADLAATDSTWAPE
jgi:hypothetical protein